MKGLGIGAKLDDHSYGNERVIEIRCCELVGRDGKVLVRNSREQNRTKTQKNRPKKSLLKPEDKRERRPDKRV